MQSPYRVESTIPFEPIVNLGNGSWYYNYDRKSHEVMVQDQANPDSEELIPETRYTCIQVRLNSKPTYKTCVEAILREYVTISEEFDLINSQSESDIDAQKYADYLNLRADIKAAIKIDFNI